MVGTSDNALMAKKQGKIRIDFYVNKNYLGRIPVYRQIVHYLPSMNACVSLFGFIRAHFGDLLCNFVFPICPHLSAPFSSSDSKERENTVLVLWHVPKGHFALLITSGCSTKSLWICTSWCLLPFWSQPFACYTVLHGLSSRRQGHAAFQYSRVVDPSSLDYNSLV